jgi:cytochrome c-type biogenesis protein CcmH
VTFLFWIISVLLFLLAAMFVVLPVLRYSARSVVGQQDRDAANLLIYKERLAELQAELADGLIAQEQFAALQAELSQTLLSDVEGAPVGPAAQVADHGRWRSPSRWVPVMMALVMLPTSVWLYSLWGFSTDLKVAELFERSRSAQDDPVAIRDLIFELGAVIETNPENGWAWYFLARNLASLGQFEQAVMAFDRAATHIEHPQDQAIVLGQYAQARYIAEGQQMTPAVEAIIQRAQRLNPSEPAILQLLGADAFVNSDYRSALTYWQQLLAMTPRDTDDEAFLLMIIAQAQELLLQQDSGQPGPDAVASGPVVEVSLALAPDLELAPGTRVFVSAQDISRPGPPLAAKLLTVADLPLIVSLSDADAVGPFNLSSAVEVIVVATASLGGTADVQSGDYQVRSAPLSVPTADGDTGTDGTLRVQLLISDQVP